MKFCDFEELQSLFYFEMNHLETHLTNLLVPRTCNKCIQLNPREHNSDNVMMNTTTHKKLSILTQKGPVEIGNCQTYIGHTLERQM